MKKMFPLVLKFVTLCLLILSFETQADPAPFGLELNKTTMEEVKHKLPVTPLGINKNNGLEAYDIDPKAINFEGLIAAKAAFSNDGILKIIQMSVPSEKFSALVQSLSTKYTLLYKNAPAEGNREAKFEKDNTYILLYAPQNSAEMDFLYINKKILDEALQAPAQAANASSNSNTTLASNTKSNDISQL